MLPGVGPRSALLGTLDAAGAPVHLGWHDAVTEHPALGATEVHEDNEMMRPYRIG